jgi:signal transduction histidine kinase/ActR/RegA family two-component response regulator
LLGEKIGSLAFIPLSTDRGVVGKIMLYAEDAGALSPEQIAAAEDVAASAGMSVGRIIATRRLERSEREAVVLRHAAEVASNAKSAFLANMSHEIRTPLTAILGFADLLREDGNISLAPEQRVQTIDTIRNAGTHLLTVINDILDLSKIEADKMTVERIDTPLTAVLHEVESLMRPRASGKGLALSTTLATPVPEHILSDPTRLRQILMNLTGNAVKFTEAGRISITVSATEQDGKPRLVIDVEDTGAGLTQEQVGRLFKTFGQADESMTRKFGGTGLGLTICRRLAAMMGGEAILLRTEPGKGSCFRLVLPLEAVPGTAMVTRLEVVANRNAPDAASGAVSLSGRILLAEDGVDNQRLIAFHLKKVGAQVTVADNGKIALDMLDKAAAEGTPYDLLLTDMQMPEMDGYSLARTLRERGSTMPIVALTAHAMAEDRDRCLAAGCDDYATKPIDKVKLLATCTAWMGKVGGATVRAKAA